MIIAYCDESGDDGRHPTSSPLFALTTVYCRASDWKQNFTDLKAFRKSIRNQYGLPMKYEIHTAQFIQNKNPYRQFQISDDDRAGIIDLYCDAIAQMELRIVNVVIQKRKIYSLVYPVLDTAFKYSIQRLENDMTKSYSDANFVLITDEGRIGTMRKTARRIQAINFVPSKIGTSPLRKDIKLMVEDPLPKDSRESYFIQIADLVARIVYMHKLIESGLTLGNRTPSCIDQARIQDWLRRLMPSLNTAASQHDPFGIVCYPK